MRQPAARRKPAKAQVTSFAAPVGGWIASRSLAMPRDPRLPPGAAVLENWFPTATGIKLRRGMVRHATTDDGSPIRALFTYVSGTHEQLFAATDAAIYDITTVADPYDPDSLNGRDVLSSQTGGDWVTVQFSTSGGDFLIGVNGEDAGFQYDGTSWQDADAGGAAITFPSGVNLTTADLCYVWSYQNRLWFIQKETLDAWYLPVDQIGGELALMPLGGVFTRGGTLLWGQAWSLASGGAGGLSDQCVFCSTEGEIAAYQGIDPGDATDWSKVGTYRVGKPLGKKAIFKAGGDIGIATTVGLVSLQAAAESDYAALGRAAVSAPIEAEWARLVEDRALTDWRCQVWPDGQALFVSTERGANDDVDALCANVNTGAWCKITGWDITAMEVFKGRFFFGSSGGEVREGWTTGKDEALPYAGRCLTLFDNLDAPASLKVARLARAVKRSTFPVRERISIALDYREEFPPTPPLSSPPTIDVWESGLWDQAVWDAEHEWVTTSEWRSVSGSGQDIAVGVQVASGATVPLDCEVVRLDLTFEVAQVVS